MNFPQKPYFYHDLLVNTHFFLQFNIRSFYKGNSGRSSFYILFLFSFFLYWLVQEIVIERNKLLQHIPLFSKNSFEILFDFKIVSTFADKYCHFVAFVSNSDENVLRIDIKKENNIDYIKTKSEPENSNYAINLQLNQWMSYRVVQYEKGMLNLKI